MLKIKTEKNKNVIAVDGFMSVFDKSSVNETKRFWRCHRKD